ncbi:galactosyltransferase-related protein [Candidatus Pantoea formicae]|uniref:galactosyltransferase-related protein n=1 Tax=Candidatus Pantoea formicae TaxID=2608355 RepID=UPI003EDAFC29
MLTAIVPLDLKRRPKDLIEKAKKLAEKAAENNIKIVFGYNNRNTSHDINFLKSMGKYLNVKIRQTQNFGPSINTSQLRNLAFEGVDSEFIILLDVDIYPDFPLFIECQKEVYQEKKPFIILPCLYLTKHGTKLLTNRTLDKDQIKDKFFSFSRKEFLHLASPSSIVIFRKDDYSRIGGFNESFSGHGYEDFDFLIRLGSAYKLIKKPNDFLLDIPYRSPLFAVGFRKSLGKLCIDSLVKKRLAFHLYHEKDSDEFYYKSRKNNYVIFSDIHMKEIDTKIETEETLVEQFISHCNLIGSTYQLYSIFFDNKPGHIDRVDTLKRRLKFIFNI